MARIPRDGCLVPSSPIAELVRDFVSSWNRQRPQPGGQFGLDELPPIRPLASLAASSSTDEFVVTEGMIEGILDRGDRRKDLIELRLADAIATALDAPYIVSNLRDEVVPNPNASKRARAACCAGSESLLVA